MSDPYAKYDPVLELDRLRAALRASGDAVYEWDFLEDVINWRGAATQLFGVSSLAAISSGDAFTRRIHAEDLAARMKALSDHYASGKPLDCEYRVRTSEGGFVWVHERGAAITDDIGKPVRLVGIVRSVALRKSVESHLEYRAQFDELTGQFNLARMREALEHQVNLAGRYKRPSAYLLISIDRIEAIAESAGAEGVDDVILEVSQRIEHSLRICDVLGRVDETRFGVVLSECNADVMQEVAKKIRLAICASPVRTDLGAVAVTTTIGAVPFPEAADTAQDVMMKAETALGRAMRQGPNGYSPYTMTPEERAHRAEQLEVAEEVRRALSENRLMFAFQPIVASVGRTNYAYECLIRMRAEDGRIVPAGSFVPVVENLGLVRQLDRYCLQLAVRELIDHENVTIALNISGLTVADHSWLRLLVALLRGRPEVGHRLIVEITETAALEDLEESARFINTARNLGCKIALDDFGAGYTSFRHLKSLPVDIVKIDGTFVRNLAQNLDDQLFVRTLLGLANAFGLETIAECVETEEIARILTDFGVSYLQGWHIGAPELRRPWVEAGDAVTDPTGTVVTLAQRAPAPRRLPQAVSLPPIA